MNGTQPPPLPTAPVKKSGMPTWAIVLIVLGVVGVVGIAVIGMLAAIAVPNFVRARSTAQMNACINNLRQIDGAIQQWALETKQAAGASVSQTDVTPYLKSPPTCPAYSGAGGVAGFTASYTLTTVSNSPTCAIVPGTHILP